jgi:outer membrane protein insertion porin family
MAIIPAQITLAAVPAAVTNAPNLTDRPLLAKKPKRKPVKTPVTPAPAAVDASSTPAPAKPAVITAIDVRAENGELSAELRAKILSAIQTKVGQPTSNEQLEKDAQAIQAIGSFQGVRVVPEKTAAGLKLVYVVQLLGKLRQVTLNTLPANSSSVLSQADVDGVFRDLYGQSININVLKARVTKLRQLYQERGYVVAQVIDDQTTLADGKLSLVVAEGVIEDVQVRFMDKERKPLVDANGLPVRGATRDFIITREAQSKPGVVLNSKMVQQDLQRIYGLRLFEDLGVSFQQGSDPSKVVLVISVLEGRTISTNFGGSIGSSSGFSLGASGQLGNLGGNGQKLGADVQFGGKDTLYNISFTDPWIAGDPNRTSYSVNLFQQRSLSLIFDGGTTPQFAFGTGDTPRVQRTGGGINFTRPLNGNPFDRKGWVASAGVEYQSVTLQDSNSNIALKDTANKPLTFSGTGRDDLLMVQLGLSQDTRNSFFSPNQGYLLRLGVDQSVPVGTGNISMTRLRGNYTQYVPIGIFGSSPKQALALNVQGGTILGDLPPYEAFSLGGNTLRGFGDGAVGSGKSYAQASAEMTFPLFDFLGGAVFADYGTDLGTGSSVLGNPAGTRGKPGSGFGYGAGIRFDVPGLGPLKLDYGINDQGGSRIHFGISGGF